MSIEEFDKKASVIKRIFGIDKLLHSYDMDSITIRVGISCEHTEFPNSQFTEFMEFDEVLADKFKQLLLEHKQKLINEFEKM